MKATIAVQERVISQVNSRQLQLEGQMTGLRQNIEFMKGKVAEVNDQINKSELALNRVIQKLTEESHQF